MPRVRPETRYERGRQAIVMAPPRASADGERVNGGERTHHHRDRFGFGALSAESLAQQFFPQSGDTLLQRALGAELVREAA